MRSVILIFNRGSPPVYLMSILNDGTVDLTEDRNAAQRFSGPVSAALYINDYRLENWSWEEL